MDIKIKTPNNELLIKLYSGFIKKEEVKTNRSIFSEMCKQCKNYNRKYSCPPKSPAFENLCNKEGLFVILMRMDLAKINTNEYNKIQLANSVLKSRIDRIMRILEKEFNTKYFSSGSCRLCKPCNLEKNLPCKHPKEMRFSLEATGIDCNFLSEKIFNFPLLWYKNKKAPEYTCVLAGLICNKDEENRILEYLKQKLKNF